MSLQDQIQELHHCEMAVRSLSHRLERNQRRRDSLQKKLDQFRLQAAELLDQIPLPANLSVHLQRREVSALEIDEQAGSVRDRGGVAAGAQLPVLGRRFGSQRGFPLLFPSSK